MLSTDSTAARRDESVISRLSSGLVSCEYSPFAIAWTSNSESIRTEGQDSTSTIWKVSQQNSQGSVDAIQEVAVQTSNFAPEYGQAAGGYFNYTMKSGTNQFHGSGYDYLANEALNAGLPFTDAGTQTPLKAGQHIRNAVRRNDFGATFGGPVRIPKLYNGRDRTFFFFNFEQFRQGNFTSNGITTVPTYAYRGLAPDGKTQGDFNMATTQCVSYVGGTATGGGTCVFAPGNLTVGGVAAHDTAGNTLAFGQLFDPATTTIVNGQQVRQPFPNNVIPYVRGDKVALAIQNLMPLPNAPGLNNNYIIPGYSNYQHTTNFSFKMDQVVSPTIKVSGYYSQLNGASPNSNGFSGSTLALASAVPENTWNHTIRLNYDQTITPTLLLHLGIGYFQTSNPHTPPAFDQTTLGLKGFYDTNLFPDIGGLTNFFNGGWGHGFGAVGGSFSATPIEEKPTANTSLTWVRGNHTYKAGGEYIQEGYPNPSFWRANGNFSFNAAETADPWQNGQPLAFFAGAGSGNPYASFLLGLPDSMSATPPTDVKLGYHSIGLFVQDNWKVTRKLTLNYGLRWDYETYMKEQYGRMQNASFGTPNANAGGRNGAILYEATCNCQFSHNYPYAFGPRLGAAYQIDSKTVLRGGAGVQYDAEEAPNGINYSTADYYTFNPSGYGLSPLANSGGLAGGNPFAPGNPYGNAPLTWPNFNQSKYPVPNAGLFSPTSPFIYFDPHNRPGRIITWSVGVQREIVHNLVVDASYVGNRGAYFPAPTSSQMACNCLTAAGLKSSMGLDMTNAGDRALLTDQMTNPAVQQRFPQFALVNVNGIPTVPGVYPGFPAAQTLAQALRQVPQWNALLPWLGPPMGRTWYDSLQIQVTKRFSHGLQAQGSFVYAKGLVNGSSSDSTYFLPGATAINDIYNYAGNKQLNQYVFPEAAVISATYTTPKTPGSGFAAKALSEVVHNWQIGAVLRYQSGALIGPPPSNNQLNSQLKRGAATYWNVVPGQPLLNVDPNCGCFNPQTVQALNPNAWSDAPAGTFSTSAPYYNNYRWQRQPQESASLARNFVMGKEGKYNLQLRVEMYNIFNRLFLSAPSVVAANTGLSASGGVNTGGYGYIATVGGAGAQPRNGQIVMRFQF